MRTAAAGALEREGDVFAFDRDNLKIAAVGLEKAAELFEFRSDFLFHLRNTSVRC